MCFQTIYFCDKILKDNQYSRINNSGTHQYYYCHKYNGVKVFYSELIVNVVIRHWSHTID
ncbi:MAG: hypothetical protein HRU09_20855 [Oligoflexales bacterium]|nr:hypothetical protein [Oligoflexales bacterium]